MNRRSWFKRLFGIAAAATVVKTISKPLVLSPAVHSGYLKGDVVKLPFCTPTADEVQKMRRAIEYQYRNFVDVPLISFSGKPWPPT